MNRNDKRPIPILTPFYVAGRQFKEICKGMKTTFTGQVQCERCNKWIKRDEEILPIYTYKFLALETTENACGDCYEEYLDSRKMRQQKLVSRQEDRGF